MKKIKIALIIILSALAITLTMGMILVISGRWHFSIMGNGMSGVYMGQPQLQHSAEYEVAELSSLFVDCAGLPMDVIFLPGESENLVLEEYFTTTLEENQLAKVELSEGAMTIRQKGDWRKSFFGPDNSWGYLRVYLPAETYAGLKELTVETSSGDIDLPKWSNLSLEEIKLSRALISSNSGDIEIALIKAEEIHISSTSGNQTVEEACGRMEMNASSGDIRVRRIDGNFDAETTSGNIVVEEVTGNMVVSTSSGNCQIEKVEGDLRTGTTSGDQEVKYAGGNLDMESSSGYIRVQSLSGRAEFKSTSGDIQADVEEWGGDISISSSSGDVELGLPQDNGMDLAISTSSGSIRTPFDQQLQFNRNGNNAKGAVDGGGFRLDIGTTSGNVTITK